MAARMMPGRGLTAEVVAVVRERLSPLEFRKRAGEVFTAELATDVLGWIGLNRAYRAAEDVLEVNAVVGIRHQQVERLVAELRGDKPHAYQPPTVSTPLGYVTPAGRYTPWLFGPMTVESTADDLVGAIEAHGLPFMRRNVSLDGIRQSLEERLGHYREYRIPVVLALLGQHEDAVRALSHAVGELGDRDDQAAKELRSFAEAFQRDQPLAVD